MASKILIVDKLDAGGDCTFTLDGVEIKNVVAYSVRREVNALPQVTFTVYAIESVTVDSRRVKE